MSLRQVLDLFDQLITMARVAGQDIQDHQPQIAMTKNRGRRPPPSCSCRMFLPQFDISKLYLRYIQMQSKKS